MSGPVWMKFYVGDYLGDTLHLSCEQHGAYLLLILAYWRNGGPLPNDDARLASIAKCSPSQWRKHLPAIRAFFRIENGMWTHKRIDSELGLSASKGAAAAKSAAAKWKKNVIPHQKNVNKSTRSKRLSEAREKATHTPEEWHALVAIFDHSCVRCGSAGPIVKDHITPIYQGGSDGIDNLQPLCRRCNTSKGPENIDHRENVCHDWEKRLRNACETPAKRLPPAPATEAEPEAESDYLSSLPVVISEAAPAPAITHAHARNGNGKLDSDSDFDPLGRSASLLRSAPPLSGKALAKHRKDQLVQKVMRFAIDTMPERQCSIAIEGLTGLDPEESAQWWLDNLDLKMKAARWDDTREGSVPDADPIARAKDYRP